MKRKGAYSRYSLLEGRFIMSPNDATSTANNVWNVNGDGIVSNNASNPLSVFPLALYLFGFIGLITYR